MSADVLAALDRLGIVWTLVEHEPVFTVAESSALHDQIPGSHTKNLFLKDAGGQFWLVTVAHDIRVDLKALPAAIGCKKVSFGKAEDMEQLLGISPGSVTPLAAINDAGGLVQVVIDAALAEADLVQVHPLRNSATLGLSGADLLVALTAWDHPPLIVRIPAIPG
jgi:Ala-tRNA(Pro) deacylase